MIKRRTPQYPKEAFLEARKLRAEGMIYKDIIAKMKKTYPKINHRKQIIRLIRYPVDTIKEKT